MAVLRMPLSDCPAFYIISTIKYILLLQAAAGVPSTLKLTLCSSASLPKPPALQDFQRCQLSLMPFKDRLWQRMQQMGLSDLESCSSRRLIGGAQETICPQ